jgi:hypothetical protein
MLSSFKKFLLVLVLGNAVNAVASPAMLALNGSWNDPVPEYNLSVGILFDTEGVDQSSSEQIGRYKPLEVSFCFSRLGVYRSPFCLKGLADESELYVIPTPAGGGIGEINVSGNFDQSFLEPTGIFPVNYDLRLYFRSVPSDRLDSILMAGSYEYASFYMLNQIGSRSNRFTMSEVSIGAIPEPRATLLAIVGVCVVSFGMKSRRSLAGLWGGQKSSFL